MLGGRAMPQPLSRHGLAGLERTTIGALWLRIPVAQSVQAPACASGQPIGWAPTVLRRRGDDWAPIGSLRLGSTRSKFARRVLCRHDNPRPTSI